MAKIDRHEKFRQQINEAFRELSPEVVLQEADRPISIALIAEDVWRLSEMEQFFVPPALAARKAAQVRERICSFVIPLRPAEQDGLKHLDLVICSPDAAEYIDPQRLHAFVFSFDNPESTVKKILKKHWELALPLARNFLPFRRVVSRRSIRSIALENALFAAMSSFSGGMPIPFSLLRRNRGFNSSTVFLTANEIRLAFLIAAASDSEVGFREQSAQVAAIAAAALGWRSAAHALGRKLPLAGGLIANGLLAFGATYATGLALEQFHSLGRHMSREEKAAALGDVSRLARRVFDGVLGAIASRGPTRREQSI